MEDFKTCTRCGEKKNILLFAKKRNHCKKCRSEIQREWSRANPISDEKRKARYEQQKIWKKKNKILPVHTCKKPKKTHIEKTYGLSENGYIELLNKQNKKCGICGITEEKFLLTTGIKRKITKFFVDHDHNTNKIRGLLCDKCNRGIGLLNDDIETLKKAVTYLEK